MNGDVTAIKGASGWRKWKLLLAMWFAGLMFHPCALRACAACYGQSDSPLAEGMNWGIFSLLGVVVCVLSGIASFFVYLGKKSAAAPTGAPDAISPESDQPT